MMNDSDLTNSEDKQAQVDRDAEAFDVSSITPSTSENFQHRLWSVEAQLVLLSFEVAILYSADGVELERVKGNALGVELSPRHKHIVRGGIVTHNHPDGSFFSVADVIEAHNLDLKELRAVSKRNPAQVLSMPRPAKGWKRKAFLEYLNKHEQRVINEVKRPGQSDDETIKLANERFKPQFPDLLTSFRLYYEILPLQEPTELRM